MAPSRTLWLKVKGGLGNQLFQYAMWKTLAKRFPEAAVRLTTDKLKKGARSFDLERALGPVPTHELSWLQDRSAKYQKKINAVLPVQISRFPHMINEEAPAGQPFNIESLHNHQDYILEGYWQRSEFHRDWIDDISARVQGASTAFERSPEMDDLARGAIAVHVRLDDYMLPQNQKVFVQLQTAYFLQGIEQLSHEEAPARIVIFTDSPNMVLDVHPDLRRYEVVFAKDHCADHIEEFLWMVDFRRIVTSNSTFSYWASSLTGVHGEKKRILPSTFFCSTPRNDSYRAGDFFHFTEDTLLLP